MFKSLNKVIKVLILGDFFMNSAWGLFAPVFALFIAQNITTGSTAEAAEVAGLATLFYWGTRSLLQIPIGRYLDKNHGEKDDFWFMVIGIFLTALPPFGFLISSLPWHIYGFQVLHAIGMAMFVPSILAIFTRHIDKGKEAFEWSVKSTSLGFGIGVTGALGGAIAAFLGFKPLFILAGAINMMAVLTFLFIRKRIFPKDHVVYKIPSPGPF